MEYKPCTNTDKEIWRENYDDYYSPSIHVTKQGDIGINYHGHIIVAPVRDWHDCGEKLLCVNPKLASWRWRLAMKLLKWDR
jgi:hypothetical protein